VLREAKEAEASALTVINGWERPAKFRKKLKFRAFSYKTKIIIQRHIGYIYTVF
jgi:hypothetical protein